MGRTQIANSFNETLYSATPPAWSSRQSIAASELARTAPHSPAPLCVQDKTQQFQQFCMTPQRVRIFMEVLYQAGIPHCMQVCAMPKYLERVHSSHDADDGVGTR